jgi:uncharacterized protein YbjQ (UPF0145 family)
MSAFTSNLTVAEHHAIRSVGFSPVGQVLGSCVYSIGYTGTWNCGARYGYGGYGGGIAGPMYGMAARTVEATGLRDSLLQARNTAMQRMREEAMRVHGDGVVAVRLTVAPFEGAGLEFRAIGTAVRADGPVRPKLPFTSDLSGQEFANLITAGWVPAGLVLGLAVMVRHDDWQTRYQNSSWTNQEVTGYTELVTQARAAARSHLAHDCARYGEGATAVLHDFSLEVGERSCNVGNSEGRDHLAEAMVIGTAIVPFRHRGGNAPVAPLPVLRLSGRNP